jgi:hypothetical protein
MKLLVSIATLLLGLPASEAFACGDFCPTSGPGSVLPLLLVGGVGVGAYLLTRKSDRSS